MKRLAAILVALSCAAAPAVPIPSGASALVTKGASISATTLANPNVEYVSLALAWSDVQASDGAALDLTYLGNTSHTGQIQRAVAAGKKCIIGIGTQGGPASSGGNTPDWIYTGTLGVTIPVTVPTAGKVFVDSGGSVSVVFYNAAFLAKKAALVNAFATWFYSTGPLTATERAACPIVRVGIFNQNSEDWSVPSGSTDVTEWTTQHGYTTQLMHDAGINASNTGMIDVMMAAFPDKWVTMAIGTNGNTLDATADAAYNSGAGYGDPKDFLAYWVCSDARTKYQFGDGTPRFIVQKNSLAAKTPSAPGTGSLGLVYSFKGTGPTSGQALWNVYNDPAPNSTTPQWRMIYNGSGTPDNQDPNNPGTYLTQDQIFLRFIDIACGSAAGAPGYVSQIIELYDSDCDTRPPLVANAYARLHQPGTPATITLRSK